MRTGTSPLKEVVIRFKDIRARTLDLLRGLSREQADFSPGRDRWSIAQIADHLLLIEQVYRKLVLQLIEAARSRHQATIQLNPRDINPSFAMVPAGVIAAFSLPLKMINRLVPHEVRHMLIRVPFVRGVSPTAAEPRANRPITAIVRDMETSLAETLALPDALGSADITIATMEHPLLGRNNAVQLLQLMSAHEQRHYDQMRRILSEPGLQSSVPVNVARLGDVLSRK
jgi:hypothetical protein